LERVAFYSKPVGGHDSIQSRWIYEKIMRNVRDLITTSSGKVFESEMSEQPTFKLIKLHGSINWFYSGEFATPGEQVHYLPIYKESPLSDYNFFKEYVSDKKPFIIPPVAEKSSFYSISLIRILWKRAKEALESADEVYFLGYSLPESDLTTRQLLTASIPSTAKIYIVNKGNQDKERLKERYMSAMPQIQSENFDLSYVKDGSIEELAEKL